MSLISITKLGDSFMLRRARRQPQSAWRHMQAARNRACRCLRNNATSLGRFHLEAIDYRIKPISVAGGAIKLKDELMFSFEMAAREKE